MKLNDKAYITIPAWVINKFKLKGSSLIIYSIIYGFSQDNNSCYEGSLEYLQEWTKSTRQGVLKAIKYLLQSNLIIKEQDVPTNRYKINFDMIDSDIQLIESDRKNNTEENKELMNKIESIIEYMNSICNTKYRYNTSNNIKLIRARLNEGFSIDDFKTVINFKFEEWGRKPVKFSNGSLSSSYLRPTTLFGSKMEEYLQQAWLKESSEGLIKSTPKINERSNKTF